MEILLALLTAQGVLGALDNFWHHEITERLPSRVSARGELTLHAAREFIYAALFITLAWFTPGGLWAWLFLFLVSVEIVITLWDFIIEDQTRKLPKTERVLHTVLAINFGAIVAYLVPLALEWARQPSVLAAQDHGLYSWILTLYAVGVFAWSLRNTAAVIRLTALSVPEWKRRPIKAGKAERPETYLVTGGTGFIGGHLCRHLIEQGHRVVVLTRDPDKAANRFGPHVRSVAGLDEIGDEESIDVVVHLAGAPIAGWPWTKQRRRLLMQSRLRTIDGLVRLMARLERKPRALIAASAVGFYGVRGDEPLDETAGGQAVFMSRSCQAVERVAEAAETLGVRVVALRIGLVFGRDGGAFPQLALPIRLFAGAILGTGRQWMSWIHIEDLVRLIAFAARSDALRGAVNATAPAPARHAEVMRTIARAYRRPLWFAIPAWVLRTALGELSTLFVAGQRVQPDKALKAGFRFDHPELAAATADLVRPSLSTEAGLQVHYNDACPVCHAEIAHYRRKAQAGGGEIGFQDISAGPGTLARYGLSAEDAKARLWVLRDDGRLLGGVDAFIAIWSDLKGYRLLAKLVALPGIRSIADALYDGLTAPLLCAWNARRERHAAGDAAPPALHRSDLQG